MRRYPAGTHVRGGVYLDPLTGHVVVVPRRGGTLRAAEGSFVRVPAPAALGLVLAPLAGAVFVIALPFIGLALLVGMMGRMVWVASGLGGALSSLFAGGHGRPGLASFLGGRRGIADKAARERSAGAEGAAGRQKTAKETE